MVPAVMKTHVRQHTDDLKNEQRAQEPTQRRRRKFANLVLALAGAAETSGVQLAA